MRGNREIMVCDKCLRACCWKGELLCEDARTAGTCWKTVNELRKLCLEHPSNWTEDVTRETGT